MDFSKIDKILEKRGMEKSQLVGALQDIQDEVNFLPREVLKYVAEKLEVPLSRVNSIATFYKGFSLTPRGRHLINVCLGTACHVRGGVRILENIERELGVRTGETTRDSRFTLEEVRCVGCCSLAPVIVIDGNTHGRLCQSHINKILQKYQ
ncbi:NADP-reducing hydrogenase subunit HndA [subsurface metagenome]